MRSSLRKLKAFIMGQSPDTEKLFADLEASSVPISAADCRNCSDPCEEGHDNYPKKFDVDMESQMLGSVKAYYRQVVISTGKSDWEREVTEAEGSLASFLLKVHVNSNSTSGKAVAESEATDTPLPSTIAGVFQASGSGRLAILNGSHKTLADDCSEDTVLVFPDYKFVVGIPRSLDGAAKLWADTLDPAFGRSGSGQAAFKSWILPYSCVILLCSHKKRDNRCSIAAPRLETAFCQALEMRSWETHTQLEHPSHSMTPQLEELSGTPEEREVEIIDRLKTLQTEKRALILRNSHTGGHRYAGNCIIYTPQGTGVWYGRVTPHEVDSIVENTIIGGKVLPTLLRGGVNIAKPGCSSLHDW